MLELSAMLMQIFSQIRSSSCCPGKTDLWIICASAVYLQSAAFTAHYRATITTSPRAEAVSFTCLLAKESTLKHKCLS